MLNDIQQIPPHLIATLLPFETHIEMDGRRYVTVLGHLKECVGLANPRESRKTGVRREKSLKEASRGICRKPQDISPPIHLVEVFS